MPLRHPRRLFFPIVFPVALLVMPVAVATAADPLDGLLKRSPFAADKTTAVKTVAAPSRVEFGAYLIEDDRPAVSLTDSSTGQSVWVALQDAAAPYFVESLDVIRGTVTLRLDGGVRTLSLRTSTADQTSAGIAGSPATPAAPTGATILDPGGAALGTGPAKPDDGTRIPRQTLRIPRRVDDPPEARP